MQHNGVETHPGTLDVVQAQLRLEKIVSQKQQWFPERHFALSASLCPVSELPFACGHCQRHYGTFSWGTIRLEIESYSDD